MNPLPVPGRTPTSWRRAKPITPPATSSRCPDMLPTASWCQSRQGKQHGAAVGGASLCSHRDRARPASTARIGPPWPAGPSPPWQPSQGNWSRSAPFVLEQKDPDSPPPPGGVWGCARVQAGQTSTGWVCIRERYSHTGHRPAQWCGPSVSWQKVVQAHGPFLWGRVQVERLPMRPLFPTKTKLMRWFWGLLGHQLIRLKISNYRERRGSIYPAFLVWTMHQGN